MIGANQYLTWKHFSELNKDTTTSFENLCRALFLRRECADGVILHSNPNHPGVEVNPVLSRNGNESISFQAKFFDKNVKYGDIKDSIEKAIHYYGDKLNRVYIYCNLDIKDDCKSFEDIKVIAKASKISLTLVTGQSILDQVTEYKGLLSLFFGLEKLDNEWFRRQVNTSLKDLGKRYNSLFNVDTVTQELMAIFFREETGLAALNKRINDSIGLLESLRYQDSGNYANYIESYINAINQLENVDADSIENALKWENLVHNYARSTDEEIDRRIKELYSLKEHDEDKTKIRKEIFHLDRIKDSISMLRVNGIERKLIESKVLFLTGEMGSGKSQLLAVSAKYLVEKGIPTILILGQTFLANSSIETQLMDGLAINHGIQTLDDFFAAVDEAAYIAGTGALIFIDAINESQYRNIWKHGLNHLVEMVAQYRRIRLVVSYRSGFESLLLSDHIKETLSAGNIALLNHHGLEDITPRRVHEFLSHYDVPFNPEYYLQQEMTNPLFLMLFCETYDGKEQDLITLINKIINKVDKEASEEAGHGEPLRMLKYLIQEIQAISDKKPLTRRDIFNLSIWNEYGVKDKNAYLRGVLNAGMISSFVKDEEEVFYAGFNLIDDYLRAESILNKYGNNKEAFRKYCVEELLSINEDGRISNYSGASIFIILTTLYARKFDEECIDYFLNLITDKRERHYFMERFFNSFIWRSSFVKYEAFVRLLKEFNISYNIVWNVFIENATKENSELNSEGLTKLLKSVDLKTRDYIWTTKINEFTDDTRIVSLIYYVESGNELNGISEKKAWLLLILLTWFLTSSNRYLRDRTSKAIIELLKNRVSLIKPLLVEFKDVDDPYILQRLYGCAFGAIMKSSSCSKEDFYNLAKWIYENVFEQEFVYPDILLRDYARLIIERFVYEYPDEQGFDLNKIIPPYNSIPIPKTEHVDYKEDNAGYGVWRLLNSMKFDIRINGMCGYGDFGRYVFQYAVNWFEEVDEENIQNYALQFIFKELGYSEELFGEFDSERGSYDRHQVKRVERIGKKYQWIAMYNILARLSDTHKVKSLYGSEDNKKYYEGPWNPYVRDFDPTLNCRIKNSLLPIVTPKEFDGNCFISEDSVEEAANAWIKSEDKMFSDFPDRLVYLDNNNSEWISLYAYQENRFEPQNQSDSILGYPDGTQIVWSISAGYICDAGTVTVENLWKNDVVNRDHANSTDCYTLYSREYAWSLAYKSVIEEDDYYEEDHFISAIPAVINVQWEEEYDASQDETTSFFIPAGDIINKMNLVEKEMDGVYYAGDKIAAFNLQSNDSKQYEFIIHRDILDEYLKQTNKMLFWTVVGEKQFFNSSYNQIWQRREGYFIYSDAEISGEIKIVKNR